LPTPGSPCTTRARLSPARTAASSRSSVSHSPLRPSNTKRSYNRGHRRDNPAPAGQGRPGHTLGTQAGVSLMRAPAGGLTVVACLSHRRPSHIDTTRLQPTTDDLVVA
jgi:hypothetical protein